MLMSVDGKISTGSTDELDEERGFPMIHAVGINTMRSKDVWEKDTSQKEKNMEFLELARTRFSVLE